MKKVLSALSRQVRSIKFVTGFVVIAAVAVVSVSNVAAASPAYFNVPKGSPQRVCYTQYGGEGWQALGFINLDHCLRYVSTQPPKARAECGHGYWFVWGFNSFDECATWVVEHGGIGYGGDPDEEY